MTNKELIANVNSVKLAPMTQEIINKLVLTGDVSQLLPHQKVEYIAKLCERVGLDPLTQPFKILKLQGREVLYADKGATQQLCQVHNISTEVTKKEIVQGVYIVTVRGSIGSRFTDEDGAVTIDGLKGDALCNAFMKAITKAKRRAVLALCGLGMLDETEIETIPDAQKVPMESTPSIAITLPKDEPTCETPTDGVAPVPSEPVLIERLGPVISEAQAKRLYAIATGAGIKNLKEWLMFNFSYESSRDILKSDYQEICELAEKGK